MAAPAIECLEYGSISPADAPRAGGVAGRYVATPGPGRHPASHRGQHGVAASPGSPPAAERVFHAAYAGPAGQRPRIFCLREDGQLLSQSRVFPQP